MTFRAFSIGFSAAVLALACGSDSNDSNDPSEDPIPAVNDEPIPTRPAGETCDDNPLLAGCDLPDDDINGDPIADPPDPQPGNGGGPDELARAQASNILASNCGQCHGPALTPEQASAGMNYINDLDKLAEEGKLVPGNSGGSRIIQRMREGSMPPQTSGRPLVPAAEIDVVAQFIDNPTFWPDYDIGQGECNDQLFDFDSLFQEIAQDLQRLDADDQATARYIALTNRFTAGVCADTSLDTDRQAIFKMVNALSTEASIEVPVPIDPDQTIYRIDLADYGWDQPVTVVIDGVATDFADRWEAIAANNPYALEFFGDDADDAKEDALTQFPVMLGDSMLDTATIGNLYYALIDVDVNQPLADFVLNTLQIDVDANLEDEDQVRAGTTKSRISRQDRMIQRDEIEIRQGVLWQSFDFEDDDQNQSIFEDPFGFAPGGTEAIFTLENGLFGFIIADANDVIVEDSDILLDTNQNNFRAVTMISCSNCHAQGLIPVADEVRDIAIANARNSGLNNDEVEQLRAVFPEPQEFAQIIDEDSSRFFQAALNLASVEQLGGDPISRVFFRFDQDMTIKDAAGDLGLTPDQLGDDLDLLNPVLQVLEDNALDRDDFTQFYVDSVCILTAVNENTLDPNLCQAVADNGGIVP